MTLNIKSKEQHAGDIIRRIRNQSDITDFAAGGALVTLIEAVAQMGFQKELAILKILEQTNIDNLVGADLDNAAASINLPNGIGGIGRRPASKASDEVRIGSAFTKVATRPYAGKPAPYAGSNKLYLQDASSFFDPVTSPKLYIGRGTDRFEGPIQYTAIANNGSYWEITLSTTLTKDHTHNDEVVLAQGGDRAIPAGMQVFVPARSNITQVTYTVDASAQLADGEAEIDVSVTCTEFGTRGNAAIGAISQISTPPFAGATVTNVNAMSNGADTESDAVLRQRIKDYPATLSRGTLTAIRAAILGASDPNTNKTIVSALANRPIEASDPTIVYIDDGSVLEPVFASQAYELLLASATGRELTFRTAQAPITPVMLLGQTYAPFSVVDGQTIALTLDGVTSTYTINASNYRDIRSATTYEIIRDFNSQGGSFEFRTYDGGRRIAIFDRTDAGEEIVCAPGDLQETLGLTVDPVRSIYLYINGVLQSYRGVTASLLTRAFNSWNRSAYALTGFTNISVRIDGVTISGISITNADFAQFGTTFTNSTSTQWRTVLEQKIPGVSVSVVGDSFLIRSNLDNNVRSEVSILSGNWIAANAVWLPTATLVSQGSDRNYRFNRYTGDIRLLQNLSAGDIVEVASQYTRGSVASTVATGGLFDMTAQAAWSSSRIAVAFDATVEYRTVAPTPTSTLTVSSLGATQKVIRLADTNLDGFLNSVLVGDWVYFNLDKSVNDPTVVFTTPATYDETNINGLYRVIRRYTDPSTISNPDGAINWIEVEVSETQRLAWEDLNTALNLTPDMIQSFSCSSIPQEVVFSSTTLSASTMAGEINAQVVGGKAFILTGQAVTLRTNTYDNGSAAVLAAVGSAANYWPVESNDSRLAHNASSVSGFASGAQPVVQGVVHGQELVSLTGHTVTAGSFVSGTKYVIVSLGSTNFTLIGSSSNTVGLEFTASGAGVGTGTAIPSADGVSLAARAYTNRSFIQSGLTFTEVESLATDKPVITAAASVTSYPVGTQEYWLTGRYSGFAAQVFNNDTLVPFSGYMARKVTTIAGQTNPDTLDLAHPFPMVTPDSDRYSHFSVRLEDLPITSTDRLVVQADNDEINKTVVASLYKRAAINTISAIASGGKGQILTLTLKDPDDLLTPGDPLTGRPFFNLFSAFRTFSFEGFNILARSVGVYNRDPSGPSTDALIVRSAAFGPSSRIRFSLSYPTTASTPVAISHSSVFDAANDVADVYVTGTIPSGAATASMISGTYSATVGATVNNVTSVVLSSVTPAVKASAFSTVNDIYYRALTAGAAGNSIQVDVVDSGIGGLSITEVGTVVTINLGGDAGGIAALQAYVGLTLIEFLGSTGQLSNVAATADSGVGAVGNIVYTATAAGTAGNGVQVLVIDTGLGGLTFVEAGNLLTVDLGGNAAVNVAALQALGVTLVTFSGTDGTPLSATPVVTLANGIDGNVGSSITLSGGVDLIPGALGSFSDINHFVVIGGSGTLLPVGAWKVASIPSPGTVELLVPNYTGLATLANVSAVAYPLTNIEIASATLQDFATAINTYAANFPVVSAEAIGAGAASVDVNQATYETHSNTSTRPYSVNTPVSALQFHTFQCNNSCKATIAKYDLAGTTVEAVVQTVDALFPTTAQSAGTAYTPVNEEVYIVPSNARTLSSWLGYSVNSSLPAYSDVERVSDGSKVQIASRIPGAEGAVYVRDTYANQANALVLAAGIEDEGVCRVIVKSAQASSYTKNTLVKVTNAVATEIYRPYRHTPSGTSVTTANTTDQNSWMRATSRLVYWRDPVLTTRVRVVLAREGQFDGTEPLALTDTIKFTNLGNGLVQVTHAGTGALSARTGDMMWIPDMPATPFAADQRCTAMGTPDMTNMANAQRSAYAAGMNYPGYLVMEVINSRNIVILAPHITTFNTVTITDRKQLTFIATPWAEKNIKLNQDYAQKFNQSTNKSVFAVLKTIGNGVASLTLSNTSTAGSGATTNNGAQTTLQFPDFATLADGDFVVMYDCVSGSTQPWAIALDKTGSTIPTDAAWVAVASARKTVVDVTGLTTAAEIAQAVYTNIAATLTALFDITTVDYTPASDTITFTALLNGAVPTWGDYSGARITLTEVYAGSDPTTPDYATDDLKLGQMSVCTDDWLHFGPSFALPNQGKYRIIAHDNKSTIWFYNPNAVDELLNTYAPTNTAQGEEGALWWGIGGDTFETGLGRGLRNWEATNPTEKRPVRVLDRDCVFVGDTVRISSPVTGSTWLPTVCYGEWTISDMGWINDFTGIVQGNPAGEEYLSPWIEFSVSTAAPTTASVAGGGLGNVITVGSNVNAFGFVESTPYVGYKIVQGWSLDSFDAEKAQMYLAPQQGSHLVNPDFGTQLETVFKAGYDVTNKIGIDGYKIFGGLIQEAHRIVDGSPSGLTKYAGTKAAGTLVSILPPVPRPIQMSLSVLPRSGISIAVLAETVRSTVSTYVNSLGVGQSAVVSEIIASVQSIAGVASVALVSSTPTATNGVIVAGENEKIVVLDASADVVVG